MWWAERKLMTTPTPAAVGVFDLETTGVEAALDHIVTAYVGALDANGKRIDGRDWMIRPDGYVIPDGAAAIHGVTTERALAEGRPFSEVLPEIVAALVSLAAAGVPIVAYNASYDFTMLAHEMHRAGVADPVSIIDGIDIIDPFVLDKHLDPYRRGRRTLTAIAPLYDVTLTEQEAHGAQADAIAGGRIALKIINSGLAHFTVPALRKMQTGWARGQRASLKSYKRQNGDPTFDLDLNWPLYESALALRAPAEVYTF